MIEKQIFEPYEMDGRSSMILTGRSIYDFECGENGKTYTLVKLMTDYARDRHHMVTVRYSLAHGVIIPYNMYKMFGDTTILETRLGFRYWFQVAGRREDEVPVHLRIFFGYHAECQLREPAGGTGTGI